MAAAMKVLYVLWAILFGLADRLLALITFPLLRFSWSENNRRHGLQNSITTKSNVKMRQLKFLFPLIALCLI